MAGLLIVVGSTSGNAQLVSDVLSDEFKEAGYDVDLFEDGAMDDAALGDRDLVLICTSTHGLGEMPDNIDPFYQELAERTPDLSHLRYGVIALGDQTFDDTFCKAGRDFDALFARLGAARIGERLEVDACTQPLPDDDALDWMKEWVTLL